MEPNTKFEIFGKAKLRSLLTIGGQLAASPLLYAARSEGLGEALPKPKAVKSGTAHVLYWLRSEGCPRLAFDLLVQEFRQLDSVGSVIVLHSEHDELRDLFSSVVPVYDLSWDSRGLNWTWRAKQLLENIRPSGVVCYSLGPHVSIASAAAALNIPCVVHLGNAPPDSAAARAKIRFQLKLSDWAVAAYAACSNYVREAIIHTYGLAPAKVVSIPNGIDMVKYDRVAAKVAGRTKPTIFGMVGSFEAHKDQATLLEAIAILVKKGQEVRLRLIGDGILRPNLEKQAEVLGIADRVDWTGAVEDVPAELSKLDVFVYSVTDQEGLGIALVEALAVGLPVVAADVGACREVLDYGRLGLLFTPKSPGLLADALLQAINQKPCPLTALEKYDIAQTFRNYQRLLSGDGNPMLPSLLRNMDI